MQIVTDEIEYCNSTFLKFAPNCADACVEWATVTCIRNLNDSEAKSDLSNYNLDNNLLSVCLCFNTFDKLENSLSQTNGLVDFVLDGGCTNHMTYMSSLVLTETS